MSLIPLINAISTPSGGGGGSSFTTPVHQIDSAGAGSGAFVADTGFSGGNTFDFGSAVSTSGLTNPAPAIVYRTVRYDNVGKYKFEQVDFDEGASRAVIVKGAASAEFDRINVNVGTVCGLELEDVDHVTIRNSWMGYNTNGDKCGAVFHNCGRVDIENLQFTEGVRYIEITGTTKEVHIDNSKLQGTTAIPDGIKNTAGARIFVNGSPYD